MPRMDLLLFTAAYSSSPFSFGVRLDMDSSYHGSMPSSSLNRERGPKILDLPKSFFRFDRFIVWPSFGSNHAVQFAVLLPEWLLLVLPAQ